MVQNVRLVPNNIFLADFVEPAMEYYRVMMDKIAPYFFCDTLVKMIGFQQLIVSKHYQIKREDARRAQGIDYVRACVSQINTPSDLISIMRNCLAFDLCLTAPSFTNAVLATNIRKKYCQVGTRYFDCEHCPKIACKNNLIWEKSSVMFDVDVVKGSLVDVYQTLKKAFEDIGVTHAIKLSSFKGLHVNVGLPKTGGHTIFDRNVYHYCLFQELKTRGLPVDDNSLDPVPIIRAPFSLHYKQLTPSLPVTDATLEVAIETLKEIEQLSLSLRIGRAIEVGQHWHGDWSVRSSPDEAFKPLLEKWEAAAKIAIFREQPTITEKKTNVGAYLRKGRLMSPEDENTALGLLLQEGKPATLASKIIELAKKKEPKIRVKRSPGEVTLTTQGDIPEKILNIPPPLRVLLVDNATIQDIQQLTGAQPLPVKAVCVNTDQAMRLLFKDSLLLKQYPRRWSCKSIFIGGLHSAFKYCAAASLVMAVKMENVWDRDMKVLAEVEKQLADNPENLIVAHLLGLDFCKDNHIDTTGVLSIFKKITQTLSSTGCNLVFTSDHSGEEYVPYFEVYTTKIP